MPVIWPLGTVAASFQSSENSQTGLTAVNALFRAKPDIVHLQRVAGRRPASAVSILFTALALAPLLLLYVMLSSVGANLKVLYTLLASKTLVLQPLRSMLPECQMALSYHAVAWLRARGTVTSLGFKAKSCIEYGIHSLAGLPDDAWQAKKVFSRCSNYLYQKSSLHQHQYPKLILYVLVQGFPKEGSSRMAAFAFHGGIAGILGLYTLFWLKLNLMQTLPILFALGIFTTVAGYNALSQQADSRLKQQ